MKVFSYRVLVENQQGARSLSVSQREVDSPLNTDYVGFFFVLVICIHVFTCSYCNSSFTLRSEASNHVVHFVKEGRTFSTL